MSVIPIIVGDLGTLTANLKTNLQELGIPNVIPCVQKSALLGTASILRRTLCISGSGVRYHDKDNSYMCSVTEKKILLVSLRSKFGLLFRD